MEASARPPAEYEAAASLFRALGSPVRIAIVEALMDGGRCVHELVAELDLPQPQVSQHLRTLREAALVDGVRRGREVAYVLSDVHVAHMVHDALHLAPGQRAQDEGRTA